MCYFKVQQYTYSSVVVFPIYISFPFNRSAFYTERYTEGTSWYTIGTFVPSNSDLVHSVPRQTWTLERCVAKYVGLLVFTLQFTFSYLRIAEIDGPGRNDICS